MNVLDKEGGPALGAVHVNGPAAGIGADWGPLTPERRAEDIEDEKQANLRPVGDIPTVLAKEGDVADGFESFFKVSGVDEGLGLVFGWGIVCKQNGVDYYDLQKNHIPEDAMVEATTDFMKSTRVHGDMHRRGTGPELPAGMVVHSFPLTTDIAKAMGIGTTTTGWMVATAPDKAMLAKFKDGAEGKPGGYTGFSIGGEYIEVDGKLVSDVGRNG